MKLYELTSQYQELAALAATAEDEADAAAFSDTLESIGGEIEEKIENCAAVVKAVEAEATAIREEEKRLAARRKACENSADRLKDYMQRSMTEVNKDRIKGKLFTVTIADNPPRVAVDDEASIPADYKRIKWEVDRSSIGAAIKGGAEITGVHLEYGRSLRIR